PPGRRGRVGLVRNGRNGAHNRGRLVARYDRGVEPRGIHHLGVAVADLDEAVATYERLFGARLEYRETVPDQGVEAASLRVGEDRVELLASLGEETPVGKFLSKRGPGMHHVSYEGEGAFSFEAEDGRYTVSLRRVVYVKRFTREARVGFTPS